MYYVCAPSKIQIYVNSGRKSIVQIKNEVGCDLIVNGGLFNMSTFQPCCWLRADGKPLHTEDWFDLGYGWNDNKLQMVGTDKFTQFRNFISCVPLVNVNQPITPLIYPSEMGGRRGRSAIGLRSDGSLIVLCTQDGAYALTPEQLQVEMRNLGCVSALMLDGGGSSQCIMPNGQIYSSRIVQNYICVWFTKENTAPSQNTQSTTSGGKDMNIRHYLDVSYCQTSINYDTAAKNLDGVIIRAGYGKGSEDNLFRKHYEGFSKAGVPVGVYWFSYAKSVEEARIEAEYCLKVIKGLKIELPVCYDFEYASVTNAKNSGVKVTKELVSVMAEAFLSTIEKDGYYAMLYTSPDFKKTYYDDYLNKYDLWLAHYISNPANPPYHITPSLPCGIWQYGAGSWPGVNGKVDLDFAYKDYKTIIDKANLNHLHDPEPITHDQLALNWAYENDFLTKDEVNVPATKGDIARMLYEYHMTTTPEDPKKRSGALGG